MALPDADDTIPTVARDPAPRKGAPRARRGADPAAPPATAKGMEAHVARARARIRRSPVPVGAVKLILPLAIAALHLATLPLVFPGRWRGMLGFLAIYFFPPLGKESVIPLAMSAGYSGWIVAAYIAAVDAIVGLFLVWNWDLTLRIPGVGAYIERAIDAGERTLRARPWIQKLAFAGLTLFVMVPFQGSGALGGSIVGRMIGMPPYRVWLAIILGAVIGTALIAGLAGSVIYAFQQALGTGVAMLVAILVVAGAATYLWYSKRVDDGDGPMGE